MTQTLVPEYRAEDIDDTPSPSAELERQADAILAESDVTSRPAVSSVRRAVRDDAALGREWIEDRVAKTRAAVRREPVRATLYAVGAGVLLGLLLNR